jgi:hypothetical protein
MPLPNSINFSRERKQHLEILKLFQSSSLETFVDIRVSETENSKKTSEEAANASCSVHNVSRVKRVI